MLQTKMTEQLTERLAQLLTSLPKEEREYQEQEVNRLLWEAGFQPATMSETPMEFAEEVFQRNPSLPSPERMRTIQPSGAETPDDLILRLLPSDGHLD
jgi:hypothetical protein